MSQKKRIPHQERNGGSKNRGKNVRVLTDRERLARRFRGLETDKNRMITQIVDALEEGELIAHNKPPKYFDGLFYILRRYPHLTTNVRKIEVVLNRPMHRFAHNIYSLPAVLTTLIEGARLESLSLQKFDPGMLASIVGASVHTQKGLKLLNLEDNSLTTSHLVFAIRDLPRSHTALALKLNNNCLDGELRLGDFLSRQPSLAHVELLTQKDKCLDREEILRLNTEKISVA